LPSM
jgi:hypothetical protein